MAQNGKFPEKAEFTRQFRRVLGPEANYYRLSILFSAFISLLVLAIPISIQMLIDQVANTALLQPVYLLAGTLFALLILSGFFYACREYILELFERRVFARLASEITLKIVNSPAAYFEQERRDDLINRYFDIMTVKKSVPTLLVGLFTILFQSGIGFIVTSLYHPIFLGFNAVLIASLFTIWKVWGWSATERAFHESEAKYDTAGWIEGLSHHSEFFKSGPNGDDAIRKTDRLIERHITMMKGTFRYTFRQLLSLLFLYALSSAALLGIGGHLVIIDQLSLGQLVAAELILSVIFASFVTLGHLMEEYYELCAAVEELDRISGIPSRLPPRQERVPDGGGAVHVENALVIDGDYRINLSFDMEAGGSIRLVRPEPIERRTLARLLKGHIQAQSGRVEVDAVDVKDWHHQTLNGQVKIIDRATLPQMPLGDYVQHGHPEVDRAEVHRALKVVGLTDRVSGLARGLDTIISPTGWPLTVEETLRLKLAAAIIDKPRLIFLSDVFELVSAKHITATLEELRQNQPVAAVVVRRADDLPQFEVGTIDAEWTVEQDIARGAAA